MKQVAQENGYVFPYLYDETQEVARAYGAVCTPDFYLYQNEANDHSLTGQFVLKYRGRLDDSWKDETAVTRRDLALAIDAILASKALPEEISSMGCSIKWK
jgi:peroxiredoxin